MNDLVGEGRDIGHGEITEANYLDSKSQSFNQIIQCGFLLEGMQWLHTGIEMYVISILCYYLEIIISISVISLIPDCIYSIHSCIRHSMSLGSEYF